MPRAHTLKGLRVDEISLVDAPANPGALHVLFKRGDEMTAKRDFSTADRQQLAGTGAALPDGSFPIENREDLRNAIKAIGRASDPARARAHIEARAKALGAADELPETWKSAAHSPPAQGALERLLTRLGLGKRARPESVDPDTYADALACDIDKATTALAASVNSILADAAVADKPAAIDKSLAEFRAYTIDAAADQIDKAMRDVALITHDAPAKDETRMPSPEEQIATLSKQVQALSMELAKAKMSAKHVRYMNSLDSEDAKSKFAAKSPEERDAQMGADDDADDDTKKRLDSPLAKAQGEIADLRQRIASFESERELEAFRKRSQALGLGEAQAETILKASKGDAAAFDKMLELLKGAQAQARSGAIFKEFGASGGAANSAAAEVASKAEVLMKAQPGLSLIAARVAVRKADSALAQRERDEERAQTRAAS